MGATVRARPRLASSVLRRLDLGPRSAARALAAPPGRLVVEALDLRRSVLPLEAPRARPYTHDRREGRGWRHEA